MKIWNQEISCCNDCPMIDRVSDKYVGPKCNINNYADVSRKNTIISKDCSFSKPITKEVFERLGFKLINQKNNWYEFRNERCDLYVNIEFQKPTLLNIHSRGSSFIGNCKPRVNNPEELKFILTSIGVI